MKAKKRENATTTVKPPRSVPVQPRYHDEVSDDYLDALQHRIDAGKPQGFALIPVCQPGW